MRRFTTALLLALSVGVATLTTPAFAQNLLRNPGFETVPSNAQGQGILPSEWVLVNQSPDTYSNDGSYGLLPNVGGNFTGVTARSGLRWVAGWSQANEIFGQTLTAPLVPGQTYELSGFLHRGIRSDLAGTGGYNVLLADSVSRVITASLGGFAPVEGETGWEFKSFRFVAPANAANLPLLAFVPYAAETLSAYPGLDDVSLTLVSGTVSVNGPEPAPLAFVAFGLAAVAALRRRRRAG
jgi:MYXO-CTERM domain-containing protein